MTTSEMIAVLQAFERGERIQFLDHQHSPTKWLFTSDPSWNFKDCSYRVAPLPPPPKRTALPISTYTLGTQIRDGNLQFTYLVYYIGENILEAIELETHGRRKFTPDELLGDFQYKPPGTNEWLPCHIYTTPHSS